MLTFTTVDGRTFKIYWKYHLNDSGQHEITDCFLAYIDATGRQLPTAPLFGRVARHSTDVDSKEVARKGSLKKALASFRQVDRKAAWKAYFARLDGGHSCE